MNPGSESRTPSAPEPAATDKTPNTDMQPDDAGTPESGNSGRGTASEGVMKQTSKTETERGSEG